MIDSGLECVITCIDKRKLPLECVGMKFDREFLKLAEKRDVDFCGENGEFHTFVFNCFLFERPIKIKKGIKHETSLFHFCDFELLKT